MLKLSESAISMLVSKYRAVLKRMFFKNAAALAASCVILGASAVTSAADITFTGDAADLQTAPIGNATSPSLFPGGASGNTVTVNYLTGTNPWRVFGGLSNSAAVTGNTVNFLSGTVDNSLYGGYDAAAANGMGAVSNTVTISGGTVIGNAVAGISLTGNATGNSLILSGGSVGLNLYGGSANGAGAATGNSVLVTGGQVGDGLGDVGNGWVIGGFSQAGVADSNSVTITGGMLNSIEGGESVSGIASNNTVTISGGMVRGVTVRGAFSSSGLVTGNSVAISDGSIAMDIMGGQSNNGNVVDNQVTFTGGTIGQDINGGFTDDGDAAGNRVIMGGGEVTGRVVGGFSSTGKAENNEVMFSGGKASSIIGGRSMNAGNASGNTVNISGGEILYDAYGGLAGTGDARGNSVTINGGTVDKVWGGFSNDSAVTGNQVNITNIAASTTGNVYGGESYKSDAINNIVTISGGIVNKAVFAGKSTDGNVTGNIVTISGGSMNSTVTGGYSVNGTASTNTVTMSGGTLTGDVIGGEAKGTASGNSVTISGSSQVNGVVFGAYAIDDGTVSGNTVTINGGQAAGVIGSYSENGTASTNTVTVNSGTVSSVVGGRGAVANGNIVIINSQVSGDVNGGIASTGDTTGNNVTINSNVNGAVYGGWADSGNANSNIVTITSGQVDGPVYSGYSDSFSGTASGNTVNISNGTMNGDVYGGYSGNGIASGNIVNITNGTVNAWVYGGAGTTATGNTVNISGGTFGSSGSPINIYAGSGITVTDNTLTISGAPNLTNASLWGHNDMNVAVWSTAGNILNVKNSGMTAKGVAGFQNYNFYLPPTAKAGDTMLTVTDAADLTNATVGVGINGKTTALKQDDKVTLLHTDASLTNAAHLNNTRAKVPVGIARTDEFTLTTDVNNLYATATKLDNPDPGPAKALLEGTAASIAHINAGADLLTTQGMANALSASAGSTAPAGFFGMGGGHARHETGSHIDVNGFSLVAGAAKQNAVKHGTVMNGLFLEYGKGNYSTYNSLVGVIRGDGDTHYFGGGYLARSQKNNGQYLEGSLRFGRANNEFCSGDLNALIKKDVRYDISTPYYGLHLALGQERTAGQNRTLDTYVKAIYTHQNGSSASVAGDQISFDAINSHRWQLGARLNHKANAITTVRTGLAYQYEFDGEAKGTAAGLSIDAPSMKGGSAILELGVTIAPKKDSGAAFDISLQGYAGKTKGLTGSVQTTWKF